MIDEPTLFILGAGASKPYGFHTGQELRLEIVKSFYNDFSNLFPESSPKLEMEKESALGEAKRFIDHFSNAPLSIDQYLALNSIHQFYGKIAIVYYIRDREVKSKFLQDMDSPAHKEDWYGLIFERMTSGFNSPEHFKHFKDNKVVFVTFNYDRSLEYFLYKSFVNAFYQSRQQYEFNLPDYISFPIIHVYGDVGEWGPLWDASLDSYREDLITYQELVNLSKRIRVIGERSMQDTKERMTAIAAEHKRIFFLGFGYAETNLDAIGFPGAIDGNWKIFGTAKGMSLKEIQRVKYDRLGKAVRQKRLLESWIHIEDKNSYELLREYL